MCSRASGLPDSPPPGLGARRAADAASPNSTSCHISAPANRCVPFTAYRLPGCGGEPVRSGSVFPLLQRGAAAPGAGVSDPARRLLRRSGIHWRRQEAPAEQTARGRVVNNSSKLTSPRSPLQGSPSKFDRRGARAMEHEARPPAAFSSLRTRQPDPDLHHLKRTANWSRQWGVPHPFSSNRAFPPISG